MVVQAEDIPSLVSRAQVQHAHIQPLQCLGAVVLSISGTHSSLQGPSQVVQVKGGCRLRQVATERENAPLKPASDLDNKRTPTPEGP